MSFFRNTTSQRRSSDFKSGNDEPRLAAWNPSSTVLHPATYDLPSYPVLPLRDGERASTEEHWSTKAQVMADAPFCRIQSHRCDATHLTSLTALRFLLNAAPSPPPPLLDLTGTSLGTMEQLQHNAKWEVGWADSSVVSQAQLQRRSVVLAAAYFLLSGPSLQTLVADHCAWNDEDALALANLLRTSSMKSGRSLCALRRISLRGNSLTNVAVVYLKRAVKYAAQLTDLCLDGNPFTDTKTLRVLEQRLALNRSGESRKPTGCFS